MASSAESSQSDYEENKLETSVSDEELDYNEVKANQSGEQITGEDSSQEEEVEKDEEDNGLEQEPDDPEEHEDQQQEEQEIVQSKPVKTVAKKKATKNADSKVSTATVKKSKPTKVKDIVQMPGTKKSMTTKDMIIHAVAEIKDKKGASVPAIKKHMVDKFEASERRLGQVTKLLKVAGTDGWLIQASGSGASSGSHFKLPDDVKKAFRKIEKKKLMEEENTVTEKKVKVKKATKRKTEKKSVDKEKEVPAKKKKESEMKAPKKRTTAATSKKKATA